MKTKKINLAISLVVVSTILLIFCLRPFVPAFFSMSLPWKIIYIILYFGYPLLMIAPAVVIASILASIPYKNRPFQQRFGRLTRWVFLCISVILLIVNGGLLYLKSSGRIPLFQLQKYADIQGNMDDNSNLHAGRFRDQYGTILRYGNMQTETYKDGHTEPYTITWLSSNEYRLVRPHEYNNGMGDTLLVKITANHGSFYECYVKFGKYAEQRIVVKQ